MSQPGGRSGRVGAGGRTIGDGWPDSGGWRGSWYLSGRTPRAAFPWAGITLVLLGAALLAHQLEPRLDGGSLAAIAFAAAFLGAWIFRASHIALWPGAVLLGYGVAGLLVGLGVLSGDGWGTAGVGAGLALGVVLSGWRGRAGRWILVIAAAIVLVGLVQVVAQLPAFREANPYVVPALIIVVGLLLVARNRNGRRST